MASVVEVEEVGFITFALSAMGLDVHMIGGHSLECPLEQIPARVSALSSVPYIDRTLEGFLRQLVRAECWKEWSDQPWAIDLMGLSSLDEVIRIDNGVCFEGPWGLSLRMGARSFDLSCPMRWVTFLYEEALSTRLIAAFDFILEQFGGSQFVLVPDNATISSGSQNRVTEGATIQEVLEGLEATFGGPSSQRELLAAQTSDPDFDGYLLYSRTR